MPREIKFKAKSKGKGEWVEGYYFTSLNINEEIIHIIRIVGEKGGYKDCEVIPETVCQFTGLYDNTKFEELTDEEQDKFLTDKDGRTYRFKNKEEAKEAWKGKKIYEGDIIKPNDTDNFYVVLFDGVGYSLHYSFFGEEHNDILDSGYYEWIANDQRIESYSREYLRYNWYNKFKQFGNVFDNPELLE